MKRMVPGGFAGMIVVALLAGVLATSACIDRGSEPMGKLSPGATPASYDYSAFDAQGKLVVRGTVTISSADTLAVTGTWNLEAVGSSDNVGPQVGTGTLAGTVTGTTISLNLNPGWADNNVVLIGSLEQDRFAGTWSWVTFAGPTSGGTFVAARKT